METSWLKVGQNLVARLVNLQDKTLRYFDNNQTNNSKCNLANDALMVSVEGTHPQCNVSVGIQNILSSIDPSSINL